MAQLRLTTRRCAFRGRGAPTVRRACSGRTTCHSAFLGLRYVAFMESSTTPKASPLRKANSGIHRRRRVPRDRVGLGCASAPEANGGVAGVARAAGQRVFFGVRARRHWPGAASDRSDHRGARPLAGRIASQIPDRKSDRSVRPIDIDGPEVRGAVRCSDPVRAGLARDCPGKNWLSPLEVNSMKT